MPDQQLEKDIVATKPTGDRVTLEEFEASIDDIQIVKAVTKTGKIFRWAIITDKTGWPVTGKPSVSLSAENDREELGEKRAIDNARDELWAALAHRKHMFTIGGEVITLRADLSLEEVTDTLQKLVEASGADKYLPFQPIHSPTWPMMGIDPGAPSGDSSSDQPSLWTNIDGPPQPFPPGVAEHTPLTDEELAEFKVRGALSTDWPEKPFDSMLPSDSGLTGSSTKGTPLSSEELALAVDAQRTEVPIITWEQLHEDIMGKPSPWPGISAIEGKLTWDDITKMISNGNIYPPITETQLIERLLGLSAPITIPEEAKARSREIERYIASRWKQAGNRDQQASSDPRVNEDIAAAMREHGCDPANQTPVGDLPVETIIYSTGFPENDISSQLPDSEFDQKLF